MKLLESAILVLVVLGFGSCTNPTQPDAPALSIRTDARSYADVDMISAIISNGSTDTVLIPDCTGEINFQLQVLENNSWKSIYPHYEDCLPLGPLVLAPGSDYELRVDLAFVSGLHSGVHQIIVGYWPNTMGDQRIRRCASNTFAIRR